MAKENFDKLENALVKNIEYWSERTTTAAELEALAAVVQSLVSLAEAQRLAQGVQQGSE